MGATALLPDRPAEDPAALADPLTGLASRAGLLAALAASLERPGATTALLLLDLDRFKRVNDALGPAIGDALLARVAQRLGTVARQARLLARTAGDGFAVLLDDGAGAADLAGRLLDMVARPYALHGHAVTIGVSIGLAVAPTDGVTAADLLHGADLALHQAMVPPGQFIPLAEEIGLIGLIGDWVLRTACREATGWPARADGGFPLVAVNVSPLQCRDAGALLASVERALGDAGLPAARLEVEITETALLEQGVTALGALRGLGVRLALDDFGTGYSSLSQLQRQPFDRLKLDRSFMVDLAEGADAPGAAPAAWMLRAVAALGAGLGLGTVVEGIETEAQAALAAAAGCTEMQGWLISPAIPAAEVPALISRLDAAAAPRP